MTIAFGIPRFGFIIKSEYEKRRLQRANAEEYGLEMGSPEALDRFRRVDEAQVSELIESLNYLGSRLEERADDEAHCGKLASDLALREYALCERLNAMPVISRAAADRLAKQCGERTGPDLSGPIQMLRASLFPQRLYGLVKEIETSRYYQPSVKVWKTLLKILAQAEGLEG